MSEKVLIICETKRLKLNPSKCSFFQQEAKSCGRTHSGCDMKHDTESIAALINLSSPANSQELKQFLWFGMDAFVDFRLQPHSGNANKCHGSSVQKRAGGRKISQVKRFNMDEIRRTIPRPCRKGTIEISGVIPPGHQQATMRVHGCIGLPLVSSYNAGS